MKTFPWVCCGNSSLVLCKDFTVFAQTSHWTWHQMLFHSWRCTVDPFLFENFYTEDGDLLRAKFKAFKFPESNFVLFKGVVNVCLDRCNSVECANGQLGFGKRRRRDVASDGAEIEQQRLYEVSMSTIIRFEEDSEDDESPKSLRAVTKREHSPSARQRQHLMVEKAVLKNVFKSSQDYKDPSEISYVEFEIDESIENSSTRTTHQTSLAAVSLTPIILAMRMAA